jgi:outer membrane protein assembly factor BamB
MRKRLHVLILCAFLCFFLSACDGSSGDSSAFIPTPSDGSDGTPEPIDQTEDAGTQKWAVDVYEDPGISADNPTSIQITSSPAVAPDGTIYIGSEDNRLYAFNSDGSVKWRYETGDHIVATPAIGSDGKVFVGSNDRQLYAINPDGTLKWIYPTKAVLSSSPALAADGTIYVGGTNRDKTFICNDPPNPVQLGTFYAVNPDGTLKWAITLSGEVNSSPVIATDGTIYVGSAGDMRPKESEDESEEEDRLRISYDRIDPCDPMSEFPPSDADPFFPVNGHLYAINPDGTIKWDFKTLGDVDSSAAIGADGTIYIGSDYPDYAYKTDKTDVMEIGSLTTGYIYAINQDGTLAWYRDLYGDVKSSPAIGSDGTIYVGSDKEDVFALDQDGEILWQYPTRGPVRSSPAVADDGTIYVGSDDGSLYALNPDGTLKFCFIADASVNSSPALIVDGTVYFASGVPVFPDSLPKVDGRSQCYAISGSSPLAETVWTKFRGDLLNTGRQ